MGGFWERWGIVGKEEEMDRIENILIWEHISEVHDEDVKTTEYL